MIDRKEFIKKYIRGMPAEVENDLDNLARRSNLDCLRDYNSKEWSADQWKLIDASIKRINEKWCRDNPTWLRIIDRQLKENPKGWAFLSLKDGFKLQVRHYPEVKDEQVFVVRSGYEKLKLHEWPLDLRQIEEIVNSHNRIGDLEC